MKKKNILGEYSLSLKKHYFFFQTDFGQGYWEHGESISKKNVKSYFRDEFQLNIGKNEDSSPTDLKRKLIRRVNLYVTAHDDSCFDPCYGQPDNADRLNCSAENCSPLRSKDVEVTIMCKNCDNLTQSYLKETKQLKQGIGNIEEVASENVFVFNVPPGLYEIQCKPKSDNGKYTQVDPYLR